MARVIGSLEFMHCIREANEVAHSLAKFSFDYNVSCNLVDERLDFLVLPLANDVTILSNQ